MPWPAGDASQRRVGESQEPPSQSLPIPSLSGTDLAALHNSQGIGTSLSAFRNAYSQASPDDLSSSQHAHHQRSHLAWSQQSHDGLAQRAQQAQHLQDELSQRAQHAQLPMGELSQHEQHASAAQDEKPQHAQQAFYSQLPQHAKQEHLSLQDLSQQAQPSYEQLSRHAQHSQQSRAELQDSPRQASHTGAEQQQQQQQALQAANRAGPSQSPVKAEVAPSSSLPANVATGVFSQAIKPEQASAEAWIGSPKILAGDSNPCTGAHARQHYRLQHQTQQYRPPKRKLPFSANGMQDVKRHSPEKDVKQAMSFVNAADQPGPGPQSPPLGSPDVRRMSPYRSLALHPSPLGRRQTLQLSPLGEGVGQAMSPSVLLDLSHHASPVTKLASNQGESTLGASPSPPVYAVTPQ